MLAIAPPSIINPPTPKPKPVVVAAVVKEGLLSKGWEAK